MKKLTSTSSACQEILKNDDLIRSKNKSKPKRSSGGGGAEETVKPCTIGS